ncbi:uncharacterized protein LOC130441305 [Diorhabda sublineata]|uniref:uncharacterized protein LOC130441305 n=1 Tax=Diorhabda sublineata TaxID=1163346 RepID=UPI0024E154A7|nr:uncharacterized protein LOC130441305 [Diorhabda sublineata]
MESIKKTRGRSKSRTSESDKTEINTNLNGNNVSLTKAKGEQVESNETGTCKSVEDQQVKKEDAELAVGMETSPINKQSELVKDVTTDEEVTNSKAIIDNPKEKVPKGRKLKSFEAMQTDNESSEKEKKSVTTSQLDPSVTIKEELEPDLYPVSSSESLGKGKRARIPNKRYSDIIASPTYNKKSVLHIPENGNDTDVSIKEEVGLSPSYGSSTSRNSSPQLKRTKLSTDLSDPKYLKPFQYGWRRELVWRGIYDESKSRVGDIYYYTPEGKKVRSRREVSEYLTNTDLTIDNFSFFKDAIGLDDPGKEIIRDAKGKVSDSQDKQVHVNSLKNTIQSPKYSKLDSSEPTTSTLTSQKLTNKKLAGQKLVNQKLTSKMLTNPKINITKAAKSKFASTKVRGIMTGSKPIRSKVSLKRLRGHGRIKPKRNLNEMDKLPPKRRSRKSNITVPMNEEPLKPEKTEEEKMEVVMSPKVTQKNTRSSSFEGEDEHSEEISLADPNKPYQPCSIRCKGVHGIIPTLQCQICLCLYHHECVGYAPHLSLPYICKNCHLEGQEQTSESSATVLSVLPPLTPINSLKSSGSQAISLPPPKLQKIPKLNEPITHLTQPPKSKSCNELKNNDEESFLVGSLTTWLPHNSKIIDNTHQVNETSNDVGTPRPQYVEYLAGRKFLVIPKQNFISVSPRLAAAAVTSVEENPINLDSASLGSNQLFEIKNEPDSPSKPENSQTAVAMEIDNFVEESGIAESALGDGRSGILLDIKAENTRQKITSPINPEVRTPTKKRTIKLSSITNGEEKDKEDNRFMENYLQNLSYGYNTLLYVFQYLKVSDLLRAGCVCTMWRDIARHPALWKTVRMKNSQVYRFEDFANSLKKHGTIHLDLRKMLLPTGGDEIWPEFSKAIEKVDTLRRIELCRCPASVVENLARSNPRLEVLNAITIRCESMNLEPLKSLTEIKELRLKSTAGLTLTSNIDSLRDMKCLKHLSLTSIRDLDSMNLGVIAELTNLESLDLGECTDFPKNFGGEILIKLTKLEKLRLEKGQGNCHTFEILEAVKQMKQLDQLELVNFDIKSGFDKALGACQNIKKLLIIPTYISQSATTNHMVLGGVLRLQKTLSHFVWGVTLELLRVTELFVDQCEEPKEKKEKKQAGSGDCIPVLKPVPLLLDKDNEIAPALEPPQVEILALPSLQKLLMQNLPTTRVKILKIPFHATWRQSITDSVN